MAQEPRPPPQFKLRRHQPSDVSAMGEIIAVCNTTDALAHYLSRDIFKYWATFRWHCVNLMRNTTAGPGRYTFVAVAPGNSPNDEERVVGCVMYTRIGTSEVARKWQSSTDAQNGLSWSLERGLLWVEGKYKNVFTGVTPTKNPEHWKNVKSELDEEFPQDIIPEMWLIDLLYIHPEWQRKGIARLLLQWGMERAREENVPLGVKGSPIGGLAYKACGFQSVGGTRFGGWFDELEFGGVPHQFWLWEPEGSQERWVERTKEWREQSLKSGQ
ncbi:hypothetical protein H2200_005472 [Cladophialophora chaetospira]|uniref:N-acetyltransferase domain-containing protein n=1 Tax=Cladophialophora chaetospira TaxID=386627 RepID=A0AA39CJN2_9EURO|nr:hypothetical protein H2200_005472 [Cladophialophora chaetospira]